VLLDVLWRCAAPRATHARIPGEHAVDVRRSPDPASAQLMRRRIGRVVKPIDAEVTHTPAHAPRHLRRPHIEVMRGCEDPVGQKLKALSSTVG
jgi:hypothetical protein